MKMETYVQPESEILEFQLDGNFCMSGEGTGEEEGED